MTDFDLLKKKKKQKHISVNTGKGNRQKTFPTLAHIVLSNGSRVDIPKLPLNFSELTSYDNLRIALEHAALAISCLNHLGCGSVPKLAISHNLEPLRSNLEDLLNHLYYAIEGFPKGKE